MTSAGFSKTEIVFPISLGWYIAVVEVGGEAALLSVVTQLAGAHSHALFSRL